VAYGLLFGYKAIFHRPCQANLEFVAVEAIDEGKVYVRIEFDPTTRPGREPCDLKKELVDIFIYARACMHIRAFPSDQTVYIKCLPGL